MDLREHHSGPTMCFKTRAYETQRPGRSCAHRPEGAVWPRRAVRRAVNVDDRSVRSTSDRIRAGRVMASRFPARQRTDAAPVGAGTGRGGERTPTEPRLSVRELGQKWLSCGSGRDRRFPRRAAGVAAGFGIDRSPPIGPPRRAQRATPSLCVIGQFCRLPVEFSADTTRMSAAPHAAFVDGALDNCIARQALAVRGVPVDLSRAERDTYPGRRHRRPPDPVGCLPPEHPVARRHEPVRPLHQRPHRRAGQPAWATDRHLPGRRTQAAGLAACPDGLARCGSSVSGPGLPAGG